MDDLAALHPVRALDVGCGTGIAARALTERGVAVLAVEPDARMADIARSHGISVEVAPFESWPERGRNFDLIISGQAWHWIEPVAGTAKAVRLLEPAGTLALFWNVSELVAEQQRAIDAAYAQYAPALDGRALARGGVRPMAPRHRAELEASAGLRDITDRLYRWTRSYTRDEWLDLIQTHSDHSTVPASVLADLLGGVGEAIDSFGGRVLAQYSTQAVFARRAT
jgi:SAM-dependent methyltransferase